MNIYEERICPECGGGGETIEEGICPICDGEGRILIRRGETN